MEPNFHNCDVVVIKRIAPIGMEIRRGDVVAIAGMNYEWDGKRMIPLMIMKRVVALPGELIVGYKGKVYVGMGSGKFEEIDEAMINLPSREAFFKKLHNDEFYVLGDNRHFSLDSRAIGPIPRENIVGIEVFRMEDGPIATVLYDAME